MPMDERLERNEQRDGVGLGVAALLELPTEQCVMVLAEHLGKGRVSVGVFGGPSAGGRRRAAVTQ